MPELPEVETVVRTLRPKLVGRIISGVRLHRADILDPADTNLAGHLLGRAVTLVDRRGKRIVITLDDGNRFYVHLGMTGQLTIEPIDAPLKTHTHLVLEVTVRVGSALADGIPPVVETNDSGTIPSAKADPTEAALHMRFRDPRRFGGVWWLGRNIAPHQRMGPEPLAIRPAQLARQLAKTRRAIKTALLDQTILAGLGNIYVDESLFAARIHPLKPANRLSRLEIGRLNRAIKRTLRRAIHHRGSTLRDYRDADGAAGEFQDRHNVYGREGQPCRVCKARIRRIVLGGRSTHFCPKCQRKT